MSGRSISRNLTPVGYGNKATYSVSLSGAGGTIGLTQGSIQVLLALMPPAGGYNKRVEVVRFGVSQGGGSGGVVRYRIERISAASGGTTPSIFIRDPDDPASLMVAFSLPTSDTIVGSANNEAINIGASDSRTYEYQLFGSNKPYVIPAGSPNGLAVRAIVDVALTTSPQLMCHAVWTEE